jgi:hypothetical protein
VLASALLVRAVRTGVVPMLRMMDEPMDEGGHEHHGDHG